MRQVNATGCWHRLLFGTIGETACGELFHTQFAPERPFSLKGPICRNCHSIRELGISEEFADEEQIGIGVRRRRKRNTTVDP